MVAPPRRPGRWLVLLLVALILVPSVLILGTRGGTMMGGAPWMGDWGVLAMTGVVMVCLVVLAMVLFAQAASRPMPPETDPGSAYEPPGGETSLQILDARYARGEMARDEYLRLREDLESRSR